MHRRDPDKDQAGGWEWGAGKCRRRRAVKGQRPEHMSSAVGL